MSVNDSSSLRLDSAMKSSVAAPDPNPGSGLGGQWGRSFTILACTACGTSWLVAGVIALATTMVVPKDRPAELNAVGQFLLDQQWASILDHTAWGFAVGLIAALAGCWALGERRWGWVLLALILSASGLAVVLIMSSTA